MVFFFIVVVALPYENMFFLPCCCSIFSNIYILAIFLGFFLLVRAHFAHMCSNSNVYSVIFFFKVCQETENDNSYFRVFAARGTRHRGKGGCVGAVKSLRRLETLENADEEEAMPETLAARSHVKYRCFAK